MTKSLWLSFSDITSFMPLDQDITVDVAIIGGGITGITTAQLLAAEGLNVAVLEKDQIGVSSTGNSTGNLYSAVSEILLHVQQKFGDEVMNKVIRSRQEAIDLIEDNIQRFNIDCDFRRVKWNYFTTIKQNKTKIEEAYQSASKADVGLESTSLLETPFRVIKGMSIDQAAQFNPLRYVQGLARGISGTSCAIYENTEVKEIDETKEGIILKTQAGHSIRAGFLVHATHTPKGLSAYHAQLGPYREYGIACKISGEFPAGIYFGYFMPSDITSIRSYQRNGENFLIAVGEPHKVGHGDNLFHLKRLEEFLGQHFDVLEVTHRWGAQNYKSPDYLPFIGHKTPGSKIFMASGFSSHGLTYGTVAAKVLSDLINDRDNPYAEIYKPTRFNPIKSAPKLIKENVDVFSQYVKDYLFKRNKEPFSEVAAGEGKVIDQDGHKFAVYRNDDEQLQVCSAVCTHMGCIVHWNNAETSWDCPCHGSRFATDGEVLEGPALKALKNLNDLVEGNEAGLIENFSIGTPATKDNEPKQAQ